MGRRGGKTRRHSLIISAALPRDNPAKRASRAVKERRVATGKWQNTNLRLLDGLSRDKRNKERRIWWENKSWSPPPPLKKTQLQVILYLSWEHRCGASKAGTIGDSRQRSQIKEKQQTTLRGLPRALVCGHRRGGKGSRHLQDAPHIMQRKEITLQTGTFLLEELLNCMTVNTRRVNPVVPSHFDVVTILIWHRQHSDPNNHWEFTPPLLFQWGREERREPKKMIDGSGSMCRWQFLCLGGFLRSCWHSRKDPIGRWNLCERGLRADMKLSPHISWFGNAAKTLKANRYLSKCFIKTGLKGRF